MGILVPSNVNHDLEINANNPYSVDVPAEQITGLVSYTHENGTSAYFRVSSQKSGQNHTFLPVHVAAVEIGFYSG